MAEVVFLLDIRLLGRRFEFQILRTGCLRLKELSMLGCELAVAPVCFMAACVYMGGCQNYGPFLGTLNNRCRIIIGTQKGGHIFDNYPHRSEDLEDPEDPNKILQTRRLQPVSLQSTGQWQKEPSTSVSFQSKAPTLRPWL